MATSTRPAGAPPGWESEWAPAPVGPAGAGAAAAARPVAAAGPAAHPEFLPAKPLKPLSAVYPPQALEAGKAGYVIVEFLLDSKGRASKPKVIEASPPGIFDAAAMAAVTGGRYDTSALAGEPARRSRVRISFQP